MILIIVIISIIFCAIFILTNRAPEPFPFGSEIMDFFYSTALATIAAGIFYIIQIYLPEIRRWQAPHILDTQ